MDENKYLILIDDKDKTCDIAYLNDDQPRINLRFSSSDNFILYTMFEMENQNVF